MIRAKSNLTFFDKLVLFFNYLSAFALLVSYLAPITNPQTFWPVAFFGLAYPVLLLFNFLFLIYWAFRLRLYFLISAVCILVGYKVLCNNLGFHKPTIDAPKQSANLIRIMAYNVHGFTSFSFGPMVSTRHDIFDIINTQQPDVMCFEEFFTRKSGKLDVCDSLQKILQSDQYYFQDFNKNSNEAGLAIFTKYPIVNHGFIILSNNNSDNQCIYADLKVNDKTIRVYCVHLQSIQLGQVDYQYLDSVSQNGKPDMHSSKRIGSKLKSAFIKRSQQVKQVKDNAAQCPYPYIIAGDFNDTPASYAVNQMATGMKNAFTEKGFGLGRTYNGDFPNFQIDYIMASPQFDVTNYKIIEKRLSDHYSIRSDVLLR